MNNPTRPTYTAEFKLESAQLVVDQGYTIQEAAKSVGVSKSAMGKWVRQLKKERTGEDNSANPLTPDKIKIKELEKKIKRIEMENEIIKKATALLISDSLKSLK